MRTNILWSLYWPQKQQNLYPLKIVVYMVFILALTSQLYNVVHSPSCYSIMSNKVFIVCVNISIECIPLANEHVDNW